ncbi:uncharacterized protein ACOB6Z_003028 [Ctenodactylus gundi]
MSEPLLRFSMTADIRNKSFLYFPHTATKASCRSVVQHREEVGRALSRMAASPVDVLHLVILGVLHNSAGLQNATRSDVAHTAFRSTDHLDSSIFPIQKGSLNLLRQKWESSDHPRNECCPIGSRCKLFQPGEGKLLGPEGGVLSQPELPAPLNLPCPAVEAMLPTEPEGKGVADHSDPSRESHRPEVLKEDSLTGRRRIERFSIALDELRSVFEAPKSGHRTAGPAEYGQKEVEIEQSLCSPSLKSHPGSQSHNSVKDSDNKSQQTPLDKMSPERGHSHILEGWPNILM